jgi:glycosyltransferase involved in cell wall biosynthesis
MAEVAGDAAVLVDPHDVESIREGMLKLIEDSDLRKNLIQKGFERAKEFSWEKTAQETYRGYQAVLNGEV